MYGYIYLIVNKVNGKTYVGQHKSNNFNDSYMGSGTILHKAFDKYGIDMFEKFHLQSCWSKEELSLKEKFWIAEYKKRGKAEYNIADGGTGGIVWNGEHPWKGRHFSEEQLRNYHNAIKYRKHPKRNKPSWNKDKHLSEETKRKISEAHKGIKPSDETRKKMSEAGKRRITSELTKLRISKANKGNKSTSGQHWYNNGIIQTCAFKCPEGFVQGRLKKNV